MFALLHCFIVAKASILLLYLESTMRCVISRSPTAALSAIRSSVMKLHSDVSESLEYSKQVSDPHCPPACKTRVRLLTPLPPQVNAGTLVPYARVGTRAFCRAA